MIANNPSRAWAQIPMPDWLFEALKEFANLSDIHQRQAIDLFVREYLEVKSRYDNDRHVLFYAPVRKAKGRTVQIEADLYKKSESFANQHDTRVNRVLMSAIIDGLAKRKRIKI